MIDLTRHYPELQPRERPALEQFLDFYRLVIRSKVEDLDDHSAALKALPSTNLTLAGIVKHLARTEDFWFQQKLRGVALPEPWASAPLADDPDWPFHSAAEDTLEEVLGLYEAACDRSRSAAAALGSLDAAAAAPSFGQGPVNLRWIYVHMIDETARHAGHMDLLRDAIDAVR